MKLGKGRIRIRGRMRYDKKDHALHVYEVPFTRSGSVDDLIANIAIASLETVNKQGKKVPPKYQKLQRLITIPVKMVLILKFHCVPVSTPNRWKCNYTH